ncbi:MAG: alpha-1,4-glucan--maltose-1-phosphate maltosyltransferase [Bacteroidota bacterium]
MEELRYRAIIEDVKPSINGGEFAIKRVVGDTVKLTADVFGDGHDIVNAHLLYKHDSEKTWKKVPMSPVVNDLWEVEFEVKKLGFYTYRMDAWVDYALNWQHEIKRKIEDDQHVASELLDGVKYLKTVKAKKHQTYLKEAATAFESKRSYKKAIKIAQSEELKAIFEEYPYQTFVTSSRDFRVKVDSKKAGFSTWYEFFPRSAGESATKHGTFKDAVKRLPHVAQMGFDVLYFPPIHPIGEKNRKGKNNATDAEPGDVGSPWAIGSELGGHKDIHPELGTMKDFKALVKSARDLGIDVALDFALQCAPDHPYVKENPQWFKWRPDGTVQYAENPPKKYQDIIPINFECEDWENLWEELQSIVFLWIDAGVRIFRVDNPHTKPYRFWKWLIANVHEKYPEIIFLSEAFTRPKVMHQLAKVGFTHSYTYFTWRNSKFELEEYMDELVNTKSREYFRPNFWPNTPDILPYELQQPNEAAFIQRFFLAATLSGNYGMYGPAYENMFYQAVPGKEEYWDSEKYEIKKHIWDTRGKIKQVIRMVNDARKAHPALQDTLNYKKCAVDNDRVMAYYKGDQDADDHILCVVNMDAYYTQAGWVQVPLADMGISPDENYVVCDLITNASYNWQGEWNFVELNPHGLPFHFFKVIKG